MTQKRRKKVVEINVSGTDGGMKVQERRKSGREEGRGYKKREWWKRRKKKRKGKQRRKRSKVKEKRKKRMEYGESGEMVLLFWMVQEELTKRQEVLRTEKNVSVSI